MADAALQELMLRRPVAFMRKGQRSATIAEVLPALTLWQTVIKSRC